jgi:signal transduction histidine kinase
VSPTFLQAAYVGVFALTAAVCAACLSLVGQVEDGDTRLGLRALLALSALWAAAQAGHLLAPVRWLAVASYSLGLVVGLASVGAWLYFCSAYAGRSYHRKPLYRRLAVGVYVSVVAFKITNPWHGLYFETTVTTTPFRYVAIREEPAFWIAAVLAYVVSAIGFYMLLDIFEEARSTSGAVEAVVGLAALPVVFDAVGYLSPGPILGLNYEPVGVGLFAIGALYVVREPFFSVSLYGRTQLVDLIDDAVLILDSDERVRDHNDAALELFPELAESDTPAVADIADHIDTGVLADGGTVELARGDETGYFVVRTTPIAVGATDVGLGVVCTDVTEIERQRRELRRKDEQLEGFATAVTHELRNSVGIVSGQAELLSQATDDDDVRRRVEKIIAEVSDMEEVVGELRTLARYSQTISETEPVGLGDIARSAKRRSGVDDLDLYVEDDIRVEADEERLRELLKQALRFAARNGASEVVTKGYRDGFCIEYDGRSLADHDVEAVLAYGNAVPDSDSAMLLPNLRTLATSHGWTTEIETGDAGGQRIVIGDV